MQRFITDERTGIQYELIGDYYYPCLTIENEEPSTLIKYGRTREKYLREHKKVLYFNLLTSGKLYEHLAEIDTSACNMAEYLIKEMARKQGVTMSVAFDSMWKTYTLTLKGQMTHRVELGSDARGNLVRIENALDKMPERLRSVQEQLENLYNQQAAAKAEVGKPFPQEQELAAKTARLIELDMELNLDGKGQPQPEQAIAKSARPSVLDRLKAPPVHGTPEKPHKKEMEAR